MCDIRVQEGRSAADAFGSVAAHCAGTFLSVICIFQQKSDRCYWHIVIIRVAQEKLTFKKFFLSLCRHLAVC